MFSAYFLEIQEAYKVLSDPASRNLYDRERAVLGETTTSREIITAGYLLQEVKRLNRQIDRSASFQVNQSILAAYLEFLLSENNIAVLLKEKERELIGRLIKEILKAAAVLNFQLYGQIEESLTVLANGDQELLDLLTVMHARKEKEQLLQRFTPWLVLLLTLLLCMAMYWYSKK